MHKAWNVEKSTNAKDILQHIVADNDFQEYF